MPLGQVSASPDKLYPVRRPVAALLGGASVALLAGLIGLGGAEFRLPLLILVFAVFPHRAVRINLLISLATLATAAAVRLGYGSSDSVVPLLPELTAMAVAGTAAAWLGAGQLARIPKARIAPVIAVALALIAVLLIAEIFLLRGGGALLPTEPAIRILAALFAGLAVGSISSLLGVAGGEFIIPILILVFGADIRTAGTASVLISMPIVISGVARHWLNGHFRSKTMLTHLVLPMSAGSIIGALAGGVLATWAPVDALRLVLAGILALSALKLWNGAGEGKYQ